MFNTFVFLWFKIIDKNISYNFNEEFSKGAKKSPIRYSKVIVDNIKKNLIKFIVFYKIKAERF